ncbi:hypothetical protein ACWGI0_21520 [Streptomyces sp. NPDC054802]
MPRVRRAPAALHDRCARSGLLRSHARWHTARALLYAVPVTIAAGYATTSVTAVQVAASVVPVVAAAALWSVPRRTRAGHGRAGACSPRCTRTTRWRPSVPSARAS